MNKNNVVKFCIFTDTGGGKSECGKSAATKTTIKRQFETGPSATIKVQSSMIGSTPSLSHTVG